VFAELGRDGSGESSSVLRESRDGDVLAAAAVCSSDEARRGDLRSGVSAGSETRAEQRRSRLQRYERELDDCFAELAAAEEEAS
jgi:hypothetical protein